jgi:adenine-specific DNA-methyltransferase
VAAIDDLIAQIEDKPLRERLRMETTRITKEKKFGLVFEEHLPEVTAVYSTKVRKHSKVALRNGPLTDLWRVLSVRDAEAYCRNIGSGEVRQMLVAELVVVRQFGEPIFPALVPVDKVQNGPDDAPWHTLIEAENYLALQLLEYLYSGQVDCIYIDPPYNSGARDWKYNNDYVDENDNWRHSKWLAFMKRRLMLAKRLLNPRDSVLIVTIDEKEYLRLGLLLEQVFPGARTQMVSTMINPVNVARAGGFGRSDEYIFFVMLGNAAPERIQLDREWVSSKGRTHTGNIRWDLLRRSGTNAERDHSPGCFYPIYIDPVRHRIEKIGNPLTEGHSRAEDISGLVPVLPIRKDKSEGNWQWSPDTLRERMEQGRVRVGGNAGRGFVIYILKDGEYGKIQRGEFQEAGRSADGSLLVEDTDANFVLAVPGSQWRISSHDATQYGSRLLCAMLPGVKFPFPKSVYAVRDSIRFFVANKPKALIVDFFSGSGTTLNAVNLLNATDGGKRQCIMITNNEVSEEEASSFKAQGLQPSDREWEKHGICQSVTWPRSKYTILGKRDDGSELEGEYLTGKTTEKEKPRKFQQIAFTSIDDLTTAAKKKQLVALIDGIPQSEVKKDSTFVISDKHPASILFDEAQAEPYLEELADQEHITNFYIATTSKTTFDTIKARIQDMLGPVIVTEEEKRPMRDGFPANLEYFRLDFLDKDHVALGRQFREILPILWLRAGATGPRPELPRNKPIPAMLLPDHNPFAVLVDETRFADFSAAVEGREGLTHIFLVTDSEEAFQEMAGQLQVPNVIQLYRDYLENFAINKGESLST